MNYPSLQDVIEIHEIQISLYGDEDGILDQGKLESSLINPLGAFGDEEFYPGIIQKASRLCFNICMNHPFADGNKRTGVHLLESTLEMNDIELLLSDTELRELVLSLVNHEIDYDSFSVIISNNCKIK